MTLKLNRRKNSEKIDCTFCKSLFVLIFLWGCFLKQLSLGGLCPPDPPNSDRNAGGLGGGSPPVKNIINNSQKKKGEFGKRNLRFSEVAAPNGKQIAVPGARVNRKWFGPSGVGVVSAIDIG